MDTLNPSRDSRGGTLRERQELPAIPAAPIRGRELREREMTRFSKKDTPMEKTRRQIMRDELNDWVAYPIEYEIFLKKLIDGKTLQEACGERCIFLPVFLEWVAEDEGRLSKYQDALAAGERGRHSEKIRHRAQAAEIREAAHLANLMQRASQQAWEFACSRLGISPVPPRRTP
jgi:hypothetical protein